MDIYDFWKKELKLDNKFTIKGYSKGSYKTGFVLLPDKIFLDAGVPSSYKPNAILITHSHQDHIDCLYNHFILDENIKIKVLGTHDLINNLKYYLSACKSLNAGYKVPFNNWEPLPIIENINVNINKTEYFIEIKYLDHDIESIGFGLNEMRTKLKDEYKELSKNELELLDKNEISYKQQYPILFFCGDMNYTSLETLPFDSYPYFIIECSFLEKEHLQEARDRKHLHIDDLLPYFTQHPNTKFILIHFSCRYDKKIIKKFSDLYSGPNVIFWM